METLVCYPVQDGVAETGVTVKTLVCHPVQDGVAETGVSVAFTVKAMDAGPVLAREALAVDAHVQAPELLEELFARGTRLLLQRLPDVWSGRVRPGSFNN